MTLLTPVSPPTPAEASALEILGLAWGDPSPDPDDWSDHVYDMTARFGDEHQDRLAHLAAHGYGMPR